MKYYKIVFFCFLSLFLFGCGSVPKTTVSDEYSFVSVLEGNFESNKISSYFIQDK